MKTRNDMKPENEQEAFVVSDDRHHRMILEIQDYAIIFLSTDGTVLDWNKGAEKLKGYKASEIIGKNFRLFYTDEDKTAKLPEQLLKQAIATGYARHEGYRIRQDGSKFWGMISITAIHNSRDELIGFSKVTKDLTEQKIAADRLVTFTNELSIRTEQLQLSEARYHRMIAEVRDYAIIFLDVDGKIQNWNAGAELIKGYQANEIIGKSFHLFYKQEDIDQQVPQSLLLKAKLEGRALSEGWRVRKDNSQFWASVVITAIHDASGALIGLSKVTRDLTSQKNASDEQTKNAAVLAGKNQDLEKLNAELLSYVYVVSHDLKEPIRKIQMFASMQLAPSTLGDETASLAKKIISSASRMQTLMSDLLTYSQISGNAVFDVVDLNEILRTAVSDLELTIKEKRAQIHVRPLPTIKAISFQMYQLFLNLISNAIKFSQPGMPPVVEIAGKFCDSNEIPENFDPTAPRYLCLTFADNGIGFESQYAERIFHVFQRLNPKAAVGGTGIGLSIVKKIVTTHNGQIFVQSVPNEGTAFSIYLPAS